MSCRAARRDVEAVAKKIHADNPDTETVVILNWRRYEEHE